MSLINNTPFAVVFYSEVKCHNTIEVTTSIVGTTMIFQLV